MNEFELRAIEKDGQKVHELKCWPEFFAYVFNGGRLKRFEIRRDDRGYKIGDRLLLREWKPMEAIYTGQEICTEVTYILRPEELPAGGLQEGFVAMSVMPAVHELMTPADEPWGWWMPGHVDKFKFGDWFNECYPEEIQQMHSRADAEEVEHVWARWVADDQFDAGLRFEVLDQEATDDCFPATLLRSGV